MWRGDAADSPSFLRSLPTCTSTTCQPSQGTQAGWLNWSLSSEQRLVNRGKARTKLRLDTLEGRGVLPTVRQRMDVPACLLAELRGLQPPFDQPAQTQEPRGLPHQWSNHNKEPPLPQRADQMFMLRKHGEIVVQGQFPHKRSQAKRVPKISW